MSRRYWQTFGLGLTLLVPGCGEKIDISTLPQFRYYLESTHTGEGENVLIIEGPGSNLLNFKLTGHGFNSEIPLDTEMPIRPKTKLNFLHVGDYLANITFFKPDGTPLLNDTLQWSFSLETPGNPIIGFSEAATNDVSTVLLVSESRDPGTDEIWIEGDIAPEETPEGSWRTIPSTSKVPLKLSEADGMKTVRVRLRNLYKNETEARSIQILKKAFAAKDCVAQIAGVGTAIRTLPISLSAKNQGPLYYRVFGDIEGRSTFQKFEGAIKVNAFLSKGFGDKTITVQIKDEAENYCLRKDFVVPYQADYQAEGISLKNNLLWSDAPTVTVVPRVDHFADDKVEMYIHGDIVDDASTFEWIPFQAELPVTLAPLSGHRWVRVQFRVNGNLTNFRYAPIYLKPFLLVQPMDGIYKLTPSNILGLDRLTISGCVELYEVLPFSPFFTCTPTGSSVQIRYDLQDGTSLSRSAPIPP